MTATPDPHRPYYEAVFAAVFSHLRERGHAAPEGLADRCAQVAFARHVYRFSAAMTAELLGISERSVERARALVRDALRDLESDPTIEGGPQGAGVAARPQERGQRCRAPGPPVAAAS